MLQSSHETGNQLLEFAGDPPMDRMADLQGRGMPEMRRTDVRDGQDLIPGIEIDPALVRIRDKYPASKCVRDKWDIIVKLVKDGKENEAEIVAKACLNENPRIRVRNRVVIYHRKGRNQYLAWQSKFLSDIRIPLETLASKVGDTLNSAADSDGKIPFYKINLIVGRIRKYNMEAWTEISIMVRQAVRKSIELSITITMQSAQAGIDLANKQKESDSEPFRSSDLARLSEDVQTAIIAKTSGIFKTIFDKVKKKRIEQGLSTVRKRGTFQTGFPLSRQIWDLRDANLRNLRNLVAGGIARGRASTAIAADIKGLVLSGSVSQDLPLPPGVYRSAYKNAVRVARTETNNAYWDTQIEYADYKGYKQMWNVSVGYRVTDVCDDYDKNIYDPDDVPSFPHPNCSCFLTTVIPEIG